MKSETSYSQEVQKLVQDFHQNILEITQNYLNQNLTKLISNLQPKVKSVKPGRKKKEVNLSIPEVKTKKKKGRKPKVQSNDQSQLRYYTL